MDLTVHAVLQMDTTEPIPVPFRLRVPKPDPVMLTTSPPPKDSVLLVTCVTTRVPANVLNTGAVPKPARVT